MIKRTKSIEVIDPQNSASKQALEKGEEPNQIPMTISIKEINGLKMQQKASSNRQPSIKGSRPKIPNSIVESMKMNASGRKNQMGKSKFGNLMKSKFKQIRELNFTCGICEMEYNDEQKTILTECGHYFCDSCLQSYAIYKVGMFQQVICPEENCDDVMNSQGKFFKNLPADIQKKYAKLHAFYVTSKDPKLKLCPSESCDDGILTLTEDQQPLACNKCHTVFCPKCFFKEHEGECDKNQIDFFQNNLHYRQCSSCKNVIERSQGCNHMTCRCGYQFCYVCGGKWTGYDHICPQNMGGAAANQEQDCCAALCECLNNGECPSSFVKVIFIILVCFPIFLLTSALNTVKLLLLTALFTVITVITGIFPYTLQLICQQCDCPCSAFLCLIYPLTMFAGIGKAFCDFFLQAFGQQFQNWSETEAGLAECLLCW